MKNDIRHIIKEGREVTTAKALHIVDQGEVISLPVKQRRKRRINYAKKISNDPFIFSV